MNSTTEVRQHEQAGEVCFSLNTVWPPLNLSDDVKAVVNIVAQSLDTRYGKHVWVCVRGSEVQVDISNDYIGHIDTCLSACMAAFEALKRNREGYVSACHEHCRKMVRMAAFESLDNTLAEIEGELKRLELKYTAEYHGSEFPQYLRLTVWL
jgi:hypothetical protein